MYNMYSFLIIYTLIFIILSLFKELIPDIYQIFAFCMFTNAVTNFFINKCGLNLQ